MLHPRFVCNNWYSLSSRRVFLSDQQEMSVAEMVDQGLWEENKKFGKWFDESIKPKLDPEEYDEETMMMIRYYAWCAWKERATKVEDSWKDLTMKP